jgi:Fe-S cluster assembly ATP-binding protein
VTKGSVTYDGRNLLEMDPEVRAQKESFSRFNTGRDSRRNERVLPPLGIQRDSQIEGARRSRPARVPRPDGREDEARGDGSGDAQSLREHGFSGGEKKRNEILQMAVLSPRLAILDETDSGLDIDALRIVAEGVNKLRRPDNATIVVTHYQRLLNHIIPDQVHVLAQGRIVKSGGKSSRTRSKRRDTTGSATRAKRKSKR